MSLAARFRALHTHLSPANGLGFWLFVAHLLTIFGIALSNNFLGLCLVWTLFVYRRLPHALCVWGRPRNEAEAQQKSILKPVLLYAICFTLAVVFSMSPAVSAEQLGEVFSLATLPLALLLVRGAVQLRAILTMLIALLVVLAGHGLFQYFFTSYGPLQNRIPGAFSHYMTFSGLLLLGSCWILARLLKGTNWKRLSLWLALLAVQVTLILTLTRNAWVATAVTVLIAVTLRSKRLLLAIIIVMTLIAIVLAQYSPATWERARSIFDPNNASNYDRLCMAYAGAHMVMDRPLYGLGPGMVSEVYGRYRHPTAPRAQVQHLHNNTTNIAAESGLLTLAAYVWLSLAALTHAWRRFREEGGFGGARADLYLAVLLSIVAFNVAGLFEANWRDTEVQRWLLFVLAIPFCLPRVGSDEGSAARSPVASDAVDAT